MKRFREGCFKLWVLIALAGGLGLMVHPPSANGQTIQWIRQFGPSGISQSRNVAVDASGVYIAGSVSGALPGQESAGGANDAYVRKYDADGNIVWTRQFGTSRFDEALGVATDSTGVYVVGRTDGTLPGQSTLGGYDAFIRKYDSSGILIWSRQFGTNGDDQARSVATDASGVYVAGSVLGTLPNQPTGGFHDGFVRKFDSSGAELWTRQFGTSSSDQATAVTTDTTGVYVTGFTGATADGFFDVFLRKYDHSGAALWFNQTGSTKEDIPYDLIILSSALYVVGETSGILPNQGTAGGGRDGFVMKFDAEGVSVWNRQFGTSGTDRAFSIVPGSGTVYIAGDTTGAFPGQINLGDADAFLIAFTTDGIESGISQFGTSGNDFVFGAGNDSTGIYLTGQTDSALPGQTQEGLADSFILKLSPNFTCTFVVSPLNKSFPTIGGSDVVNVTAASGCTWSATSQSPFITITSSAGGAGSGVVLYSVAESVSTASRTGTLSIAGQTFTVTQAGSTFCNYSISPTAQSFSSAGGTGTVTVFSTSECVWTATSSASFVTITSGSSSGGNGTVGFSVAQNLSPLARSAVLTVAGATFLVTQAGGTPCAFSINPTSQSFLAAGGNGSASVSAASGCSWVASSNAPWITINSGSLGTGNGNVFYTVGANNSTQSRSGSLTIAGITLTVTQAGIILPPPPAVSEGGVVNNASFTSGPTAVAPGAIAAVFGANLNNGASVTASSFGTDGKLVTTLGGASVRVNNIPAPLFYSFPGQLGIQIPFELAGLNAATLEVTVAGQTSAPRTILLDTVSPGIFTVTQDGRGAGVVVHGNFSLVSPQNPARRDEEIALFATGLGPLNPPLATGSPASINPTSIQPSLLVDGVPATVTFSGASPGFVGLYQVNFRIPSGTRLAQDIPVVLNVAGRLSNPVTISVGP